MTESELEKELACAKANVDSVTAQARREASHEKIQSANLSKEEFSAAWDALTSNEKQAIIERELDRNKRVRQANEYSLQVLNERMDRRKSRIEKVSERLGDQLSDPAESDPGGPRQGQQGKDVIYVATARELVRQMLDTAKLTSKDYLVDLGSGDGRIVIEAAKRGARALGIEFNPELVEYSRKKAAAEGVTKQAQFVQGDLFTTDFSQATVVTIFLLPDLNKKLVPTLLKLRPGTRVISVEFSIDNWKPDQTVQADSSRCKNWCRAHFYTVPRSAQAASAQK